ncbi:MAG: hypothetical protein V1839_02605 [archaeon]
MALEDELKKDVDWLLSLKEDFDDEGAMPPKKETIDKSMEYAKRMIGIVKSNFGIALITPFLEPDGEAGAAVHWRTCRVKSPPEKEGEYEILMRVPPEGAGSYYAEIWYKGQSTYQKYAGSFSEKTEKLLPKT